MTWPWTSRARLTDAEGQIEWLRTQNRNLTDQLVRVQRVQHGMSEVPREKKAPPQAMPPELRRYIKSSASASLSQSMMKQAFARHREGETWEEIMDAVMPTTNEGE